MATAPTMATITREALVEKLNEDLAREYQAIIAYVTYSQVLKGRGHSRDPAAGAGAPDRPGDGARRRRAQHVETSGVEPSMTRPAHGPRPRTPSAPISATNANSPGSQNYN